MNNFIYLTLFSSVFDSYFQTSIPQKAYQKGCFNYRLYNIRHWANRGQVDDYLYGGGKGMLLRIDCLVKTLAAVYEEYGPDCYVILLSPQGQRFTQKEIPDLVKKKNLVFICGYYEGFDARALNYADKLISVGDFINTNGELPALIITDALIRALPGVLDPIAYQNETFSEGDNFDFDAYTRPAIFENQAVPQILLSGHHEEIRKWRKQNSLQKAQTRIPSQEKKIIPNANRWRLIQKKNKN